MLAEDSVPLHNPREPYIFTMPPGATLPGKVERATQVRRYPRESHPENAAANGTISGSVALARWTNVDERANAEILQWSAYKCGFDKDTLRVQVARESLRHQVALGDVVADPRLFVAGDQPPCPMSSGIMQVKQTAAAGRIQRRVRA